MKKLFILFVAPLFLCSCIDKKVEGDKKVKQEVNQKIDTIVKAVDENFDMLKKESDEIEDSLKELDNL